VSNKIERVNYYERQYLRSFDFAAEQRYHLEMRRRLNLALHLWGIVDGLEIVREPADKSKPVEQVYITPGMAIDVAGREIIVPFTRLLDEDDLLANRINVAGRYSLWIAYDRELATPPSPGYRVCDIEDQYTRWRESFKILIRPSSFSLPATLPDFFGSLPDDPAQEWPVRLGTIQIVSNAGKLEIDGGDPEQRVYVGLKAQRILAPAVVPPLTNPPFKPEKQILQNVTPVDAPVSVAVEADLFARKNMVLGDNFFIDENTIKPTPSPTAPATFPNLRGNLKVAGDMFLQGNFYAGLAGEWLDLQTYIKSLMPDIQVGTKTYPTTPTGSLMANDTDTFPITSKLPVVHNATMIVGLSGFDRLSWNDYVTWLSDVNTGSPVQIKVTADPPPSPQTNSLNTFDFNISWSIGPTSSGATPLIHITSLTVSYVAIFYP
jgi:hypothetical protein